MPQYPSFNKYFILIMPSDPDDIFSFQKEYMSDVFLEFFIFEWHLIVFKNS